MRRQTKINALLGTLFFFLRFFCCSLSSVLIQSRDKVTLSRNDYICAYLSERLKKMSANCVDRRQCYQPCILPANLGLFFLNLHFFSFEAAVIRACFLRIFCLAGCWFWGFYVTHTVSIYLFGLIVVSICLF